MGRVRAFLTSWRTWESLAIIAIFVFSVVTTAPFLFGDLASTLGVPSGVGVAVVLGSLLVAVVAFLVSLVLATDPLTEEPE